MTTPTAAPRPLIGLPADIVDVDGLPFHAVGDKYVRAVAEAAGGHPLMVPSLGSLLDLDSLLARLDGVVVTGATSNVHPGHYQGVAGPDSEPYDEARDSTTLDLIRRALALGTPLLCICRGHQELNVALGGTLQSEVQALTGRLDHRAPRTDDLEARYGPVHTVTCTAGGLLERVMGKSELRVNSLHRQAIGRLADGLAVEAAAPDGTIEAVSVPGARGFALSVQWHPEYRATENPDSMRLFGAFGDAARVHARREPAYA